MTRASYSDKGSANLKERSTYVYDYRGLLVKKTYQDYVPSNYVQIEGNHASKSVTEYYEYTPDGKILYTENSSTKKNTNFTWANQTLWCQTTDNVVYYHHTDHLGTTEVVTDSEGKVVWSADYEAFGSVLNEHGESNFTPSYTGKFFDKSSGLYYFNARWYDSELSRFTSCDPARDGVNWYIYCKNRALIAIDPTGKEEFPFTSKSELYSNLANLSSNANDKRFYNLISKALCNEKESTFKDEVISKLSKAPYIEDFESIPKINNKQLPQYNSIQLDSNILAEISTSLPKSSDMTATDIPGGISIQPQNKAFIMSSSVDDASLLMSVTSKMGDHVGEVRLQYEMVNNNVTGWNIYKIQTNGKKSEKKVFSEKEAKSYLKNSPQKIFDKKNNEKQLKKLLKNIKD